MDPFDRRNEGAAAAAVKKWHWFRWLLQHTTFPSFLLRPSAPSPPLRVPVQDLPFGLVSSSQSIALTRGLERETRLFLPSFPPSPSLLPPPALAHFNLMQPINPHFQTPTLPLSEGKRNFQPALCYRRAECGSLSPPSFGRLGQLDHKMRPACAQNYTGGTTVRARDALSPELRRSFLTNV